MSDRPCPLRAEKKFWNHEVRTWTAPASMKLLNRKLWREIDDVKFSYALHGRVAAPPLAEAYEAAAKEPDGLLVRLVSPFYLRKGGFCRGGRGERRREVHVRPAGARAGEGGNPAARANRARGRAGAARAERVGDAAADAAADTGGDHRAVSRRVNGKMRRTVDCFTDRTGGPRESAAPGSWAWTNRGRWRRRPPWAAICG